MKKKIYIYALLLAAFAASAFIQGCSSAKETLANKSGAQLWSENCIRCHNGPSPTEFTDVQWKTIGMHMQIRANLTSTEAKKIVEFLQSAN
ncbi:MAG: cytochrome c [Bacteroidota bacterium]